MHKKGTTMSLARQYERRKAVASATQQWVAEHIAANDGAILIAPADPTVGIPLNDLATERLWTPIVGTLGVTLSRRLLYAMEQGYLAVNAEELALSLGLGTRISMHCPLIRALTRALAFRLLGRDKLSVLVSDSVRYPGASDAQRTATLWTAS